MGEFLVSDRSELRDRASGKENQNDGIVDEAGGKVSLKESHQRAHSNRGRGVRALAERCPESPWRAYRVFLCPHIRARIRVSQISEDIEKCLLYFGNLTACSSEPRRGTRTEQGR